MDKKYDKFLMKIPERLKKIAEMRETGLTWKYIGETFNVSGERARQLYGKYNQINHFNDALIKSLEDTTFYGYLVRACYDIHEGFTPLVTRTYNCLFRSSFISKIEQDIYFLDTMDDDILLSIKTLDKNLLI